jgi:hypothetical protein
MQWEVAAKGGDGGFFSHTTRNPQAMTTGHSAPCMWMRGGTSKGGYFLKDDLPADTARAMRSCWR